MIYNICNFFDKKLTFVLYNSASEFNYTVFHFCIISAGKLIGRIVVSHDPLSFTAGTSCVICHVSCITWLMSCVISVILSFIIFISPVNNLQDIGSILLTKDYVTLAFIDRSIMNVNVLELRLSNNLVK